MIDQELVTRKLTLVAQDLRRLEDLVAKGAERYVERMIGRMIDVNYHVLTESGQAPPPDYFESFLALARLGVLEPAFARRLAPSAGLRNRIVHEYDAIDPGRVFDAIQLALEDVPAYVPAVQRFLGAPPQ